MAKLTTKEIRLLRTRADEVESLTDEESFDLLSVLLYGLNKDVDSGSSFFLPDYQGNAKTLVAYLLNGLEELSEQDAFGTEGWQRGLFGVD
jgi:hypothetical protein